jgi:hypothetical protein
MINYLILFLLFIQSEVPYKASSEFELKMDFSIQERSRADPYTLSYDQSKEDRSHKEKGGSLPFLKIQLKVLAIPNQEVRIRIIDNDKNLVSNKKIEVGTEVTLEWGFTEDIKDKIVTNEFTILFLNADKKPVSRIYMTILEDGTFFVNEEKRGKF